MYRKQLNLTYLFKVHVAKEIANYYYFKILYIILEYFVASCILELEYEA